MPCGGYWVNLERDLGCYFTMPYHRRYFTWFLALFPLISSGVFYAFYHQQTRLDKILFNVYLDKFYLIK